METETRRGIFAPHYAQENVTLSDWWFQHGKKQSLELRLLRKITEAQHQLRGQTTLSTSHNDLSLGNKRMRDLSVLTSYLKQKGVVESAEIHSSRINDAPAFYTCNAMQHYLATTTDGFKKPVPLGNGFGKDPAIALSQAFGECLERYALSLYHKKDLFYGTPPEAQKRHAHLVHPSSIAGLSREQHQKYGHKELDESRFGWAYATHLLTGNKTLFPAQVVHWNYAREKGEPGIKDITTNGAGGWFTRDGAILSGMCELIQRDAFMIHWFNFITPPQIDPETVPESSFKNLYEETKRYQYEVQCLNLTIDTMVPTFGVVLSDNSGVYPSRVLGLSTNLDPLKALYRALEEAWSLYYWMRTFGSPTPMPSSFEPFADRTIDQRKRASLFGTKENEKYYKFLFTGKQESFSNVRWHKYPDNEKEALLTVVKHIASLGEEDYETYVYTPDMPILNEIGYYAAQVIVPALVPIHINEPLPHLGAKRLRTVPPIIGSKAVESLNTIPQPFP